MAKQVKASVETKASRNSVQYATLALGVIAVALLAYIAFFPPPAAQPLATPTPVPTATPAICAQPTPMHTAQEAKDYLSRVMAMYRNFIRGDVPTPSYDPYDRTWNAVVLERTQNGEFRYHIKLNDTPALMFDQVTQEVVKPLYITQDKLLTNGTLLLAGKINCSEGSKVRMMEFSDPYCPSCILGDILIDAFRQKYNSSITFEYHVLPSTMQVMENSYGRDEVDRFAYYAVCAQEQGLLDAFKPCATRKYQQKSVDAPLTKGELDACLPSALNRTRFDKCLETAFGTVAFDKSVAQTYSITETPVVLFDCQYRVYPEYLEHGFCFTHPGVSGCS